MLFGRTKPTVTPRMTRDFLIEKSFYGGGKVMLDESEAWQLVEHLTETTIKQFPNQEIWLLNEWVPKLLQESILYPDRDYLPLAQLPQFEVEKNFPVSEGQE